MLLASVHQTLSQYAARFYPGQTLGWVAGCHHDRAHAHVHAVIHPTTSDGKLLRVSGLKDDELGEDKFEFLRKSYNTRSRQLFVGLTQQEGPKEEDLALSARQLMLLSHYALIKSRPQEPGALTRATEMLNGWAGAKDYSAVVSEASNATEEEYRMAEPATPNPATVRARWGQIRAEWDQSRSAHLDAAMGAFKAVTAHRTAPDSYAPVRTTFARSMVPMEPEYEALASVSAGVPVTSRTEALAARRAASDRNREDVNVALEAYRASLERCRPNLDMIRVRAANGASQVSLAASLSLGVPLSFKDVGLDTGKPVPRMLVAKAKMEAYAVRGVTVAIAEAFMLSEEERGVASKTYNNILGTLSAVFTAASARAGLAFNPFGQIPKKSGKMVHRRPFPVDELERILAAAKDDAVVGPVVITAVCTGMRRADCAKLQWRVVEMEKGEMSPVADKNGELLYIPLLAPLRACLESIPRKGAFCFPAAAAMLSENPDGLTWRLAKILKKAGIAQPEEGVDYGKRLKKPSLDKFHALKTSFVTLALTAGISIEIVRKVVGNTVVEVVRKHYFRPAKEDIKAEFQAKFPEFLSPRAKSDPTALIHSAIASVQAMTPENLTQSKAKVIEILEQASGVMSATSRTPVK